jgi:hypothetical protein
VKRITEARLDSRVFRSNLVSKSTKLMNELVLLSCIWETG